MVTEAISGIDLRNSISIAFILVGLNYLVIDLLESFCVHLPDEVCLLVFRLVPFCLTPLGLVKVSVY